MGLNVHGGGPIDCGWMESPRDGLWGLQNRGAQADGSPEGTPALPCVRTQGILYEPLNALQCHKCAY